ncbi:MAG: LysM peptidoglycan-binding domain-containing protein [Leadbetterella sp.]
MKISKLFLTFSILFVLSNSTQAQDSNESSDENFKVIPAEEPAVVYPYNLTVIDERDQQSYSIKIEDPVLIEERLRKIQKSIPLTYNSSVKLWLDFFLIRRPSFTKTMLENQSFYFPIFEKYLAQNGMPTELKYLSMLESALNPKAVSRSKAVGLWQFMSFTGREMGLTINDHLDERMHIEKSTQAACKYLGQLYSRFSDWELALASYNVGPNRIGKEITKTGLTSYWDLHPYIPKDTRNYVPQFIAIMYLMNYGNEHGIYAEKTRPFIPTEKVIINSAIDMRVLSDVSKIDVEVMRSINPHFKTSSLPESFTGHEVYIPKVNFAYFNSNRTAILDSAGKHPTMVSPTLVENKELLASGKAKSTTIEPIVIGEKPQMVTKSTPKPVVVQEEQEQENEIEEDIVRYRSVVKEVKKVHKVKKGEFLIRIANKYDVTTSEIKRWNKLKSNNVKYGQKLIVFTNEKVKVREVTKASKKTKKTQDVLEPNEDTESLMVKSKDSKAKKSKKKADEDDENNTKSAKNSKKDKKKKTKKELEEEGEGDEKLAKKSKSKKDDEKGKYIVHKVKAGDTLWNICQKYEGVSVDDIKKLNKIKGNTVKVGQKIKIKA